MKYIDDLSFSGLVGLIQQDEKVAANTLNKLALELDYVRKQIEEAEIKLYRLESRKRSILGASLKISEMIQKELPLSVKRRGYYVVVSHHDLTIERNVI